MNLPGCVRSGRGPNSVHSAIGRLGRLRQSPLPQVCRLRVSACSRTVQTPNPRIPLMDIPHRVVDVAVRWRPTVKSYRYPRQSLCVLAPRESERLLMLKLVTNQTATA